ncbi:MAG: hypothetical protein WC058_02430 [Phycisphaeraceae bacterium]
MKWPTRSIWTRIPCFVKSTRRCPITTAKEILERLRLKPDEVEILLDALPDLRAAAPGTDAQAAETILHRWNISAHDLTTLVDQSPSLRGMLFGYVAEFQFTHLWLKHPDVSYAVKPDDHNRKKKGDRVIVYKGLEFSIEVKSLQTNSIRENSDGTWSGKAQCDGSDRRIVQFKNGSKLSTTCLLCGEFDLLAINCFGFEGKWNFAFARNEDLPRSTYSKYTKAQRQQLLASLVPITWPPQPPFSADPFPLLDAIARDRKR